MAPHHYGVAAPSDRLRRIALHELPVLDRRGEAVDGCPCDGGHPKNFARPCLLLLLAESPAHGYELIDRLRPFGFEIGDPASVYKTLRAMEQDGLVSSEWELSSRGPARRVYALTSDGQKFGPNVAWTGWSSGTSGRPTCQNSLRSGAVESFACSRPKPVKPRCPFLAGS